MTTRALTLTHFSWIRGRRCSSLRGQGEFHKYLKENQSSLLDFDDDELDDDEDEEGGDDYVQDEDALADVAGTIASSLFIQGGQRSLEKLTAKLEELERGRDLLREEKEAALDAVDSA